jgi:hypothetical protein
MPGKNLAKWQLIDSVVAVEEASGEENRNTRLEALKGLLEAVEKRGALGRIWMDWEGSWKLELGHTVE